MTQGDSLPGMCEAPGSILGMIEDPCGGSSISLRKRHQCSGTVTILLVIAWDTTHEKQP